MKNLIRIKNYIRKIHIILLASKDKLKLKKMNNSINYNTISNIRMINNNIDIKPKKLILDLIYSSHNSLKILFDSFILLKNENKIKFIY